MAKRVIIGAVLEDNPENLHAFLNGLSRLDTTNLRVAFFFVGVHFSECSNKMVGVFLKAHKGLCETDYVQREILGQIPVEHREKWHSALIRNRIIQEAVQSGSDALLLLDSNTIVRPSTLKELLNHQQPWVEKLVFAGETPLASPNTATPFSEVRKDYFVPNALIEIATGGSCMLLQGNAIGPQIRYQYFPRLGFYTPDQHLSLRATLCQFPRLIDTSNPLQVVRKTTAEAGSLEWLSNGVAELLSLSPESTGSEGADYLCHELKEQREADAEELAAQLRAEQIHTRTLPVSIIPNNENEAMFTLQALQTLKSQNIEEHYCFMIDVETREENGFRRISGLDTSQYLDSEIQEQRPAQIQRYAIPPLLGLDTNYDKTETTASGQSPSTLMRSITGLQVYRLPH